jgi:hypothetical protein
MVDDDYWSMTCSMVKSVKARWLQEGVQTRQGSSALEGLNDLLS